MYRVKKLICLVLLTAIIFSLASCGKKITAEHATVSNKKTVNWASLLSLYSASDKWDFNSPYLLDDVIYIDCTVKFCFSGSWKHWNNNYGYGTADLNDISPYPKTVTIKIYSTVESWEHGDTVSFTIEIPVGGLENQYITDIDCSLGVIFGSINSSLKDEDEISATFTVWW